jgi:hypothetical protein
VTVSPDVMTLSTPVDDSWGVDSGVDRQPFQVSDQFAGAWDGLDPHHPNSGLKMTAAAQRVCQLYQLS